MDLIHKIYIRQLMGTVFLVIFVGNIFRFYPTWLDGWVRVFWFDAAVGILFGMALLWDSGRVSEKFAKRPLVFSGLFVLFLAMVSLNKGDLSELTYLARVVYASVFVVFLVGPWFKAAKEPYQDLTYLIYCSIPFVAIIFVAQMLPLSTLTEAAHLLYGTEKLRDIFSGNLRVYGSFYNANWAGVYLMVAWVVVLWRWQLRLNSFHGTLLMCVLLMGMTIATGSRSAVIGIVISLMWFMGLSVLLNRKVLPVFRVTGLLGSIIVMGLAFYHLEVLPNLRRFEELFVVRDASTVGSVSVRLDTWREGWAKFLEAPLLGPGVEGIAHNSLITWVLAFGALGGGVLIWLMATLVYRWVRIGVTKEVQISSAIFVGFFVMAQTAEFFFTTQLLLLVLPLIFGVMFMRNVPRRRRLDCSVEEV